MIMGAIDQRASRSYRADIDGLRAVAVLAVVAYHLGIRHVPGGYLGVDIFFVISGYLIGGQLLAEVEQGRFSIGRFYVRRFRRIVPALATALLLTTLAAWFVLLPRPLENYAMSLVATALSASNIFFWRVSDYFSAQSETMPLLHLWSLAVEEQFYLLFPMALLVARRWGRRAFGWTVALGIVGSLALAAVVWTLLPIAAFYLLPTRLWEFLIGVALVGRRVPIFDRRAVREAAASFAALAVLVPLFVVRPWFSTPGVALLPACFGAALLLLTGAHGETMVSRLLSLRPAVFFGLISYSLYLYHWPVIVLAREGLPTDRLDAVQMALAFAVSFALAWFSWRWVERPWRSPGIAARTIVNGTVLAVVLLLAIGAALLAARGVPTRFNPAAARVAWAMENPASNDMRRRRCFLDTSSHAGDFDRALCLSVRGDRPAILLMGDSHAAHLWSGLVAEQRGFEFLQATASGCRPTIKRVAQVASRCAETLGSVYADYRAGTRRTPLLLAGNWDGSDIPDIALTLREMRALGVRVVLAGPVARYRKPLPLLVTLSLDRHDPGLAARLREPDDAALDRDLERIAHANGAIYFSPYRALCPVSRCIEIAPDGLPVLFDIGHLTTSGSRIVARQFPADALTRVLAARPVRSPQ